MEDPEIKNRSLMLARVRAIILGIACLFPAFFVSLLITIPWSKHYWAGDGQAVLGGLAISFDFGIVSARCGLDLHALKDDCKELISEHRQF
jgi:hypothetical protein